MADDPRRLIYARAEDVPAEVWRWPNFTPFEFECKGSHRLVIVPAFMDRLQALRAAAAIPFPVSSGYRSPEHNARVSATGATGPHTTGRAVDINIEGADAFKVVRLALAHGFTGIGIAQKGAGRFIHLDDLIDGPASPRPRIWSY
jgi:hypothetical protein